MSGSDNPNTKPRGFTRTHGLSRSPEYRCWQDMIQRCINKKCKAYSQYGGRGITVCDEWVNSFSQFLEDVGKRPSPEHSLDRINNDKGYSKDNCRWATWSVQIRNTRPRNNKKFKGTYFDNTSKKYKARIYFNGKCKYLGSFATEQEAGEAYKLKHDEIYGEVENETEKLQSALTALESELKAEKMKVKELANKIHVLQAGVDEAFNNKYLRNTSLLTSNPPQNGGVWDLRNGVTESMEQAKKELITKYEGFCE